MNLLHTVQQVSSRPKHPTAPLQQQQQQQQGASPEPEAVSVAEEAPVPCRSWQASKLADRSETSPSPHAVVPCDAAVEAPSRPITLPLPSGIAEPAIATEQINPETNTRDIGIITGMFKVELKQT